MKREQLRKSLDTALAFEKLINIFRNAVKQELADNEDLNDELVVTIMIAFNGLGSSLAQLHNTIGLINDHILIYGNGEGVEKNLTGKFYYDGEEDFGDTYDQPDEKPPYEFPEDFKSDWELDNEDT